MWEEWEHRYSDAYSDHLPQYFNGLNLWDWIIIFQFIKQHVRIIHINQCILNDKVKLLTIFIWQRGTSENIFKVKSLTLLKVEVNVRSIHSQIIWLNT